MQNPPRRKTTRIPEYDYTLPGCYFVTICVKDKACKLSRVIEDKVELSEEGKIVRWAWEELPKHFENIILDEFVIMPNHVHGVIWIQEKTSSVEVQHAEPLLKRPNFKGPFPGSLGAIVRSFKSAATKHINYYHHTPGNHFWQRNYYEHIIRNEEDLHNIRNYIQSNPLMWMDDEENPVNLSR